MPHPPRPFARPPALLAAGLLLALLVGPLGAARAQPAPLRIVATTGMVGDVAARVGADCAEVTTLMGPGTDPHLYRASAADVRALSEAELILYSGYLLEGQLGEVLERFGRRTPVVAVAERAVGRDEAVLEPGTTAVDPHLWMDAGLWARTPGVVAAAAAAARPECAAAMRERAERLRLELEALDRWVAEAVATIPAEQRVLVTAHDAFAYYGRAYGIEVAGIQGISTQAEAAIRDIQDTARLVLERRVPALFVESTISPRTIEAVLEAVREAGGEVRLGGQLLSDAMAAPGERGGTYPGMIYENTATIVLELGGRLPPLPAELAGWAEAWGLAGE